MAEENNDGYNNDDGIRATFGVDIFDSDRDLTQEDIQEMSEDIELMLNDWHGVKTPNGVQFLYSKETADK